MTLYGIPTCATCRKAIAALQAAGHPVRFHDVRKTPLAAEDWAPLIAEFGAAIVNRRSPSFRALDAELQAASPEAQLLANPTLMKRPLIRDGGRMTLGWDAAAQAVWL